MTDSAGNSHWTPMMPRRDFYVTGGTLRPDAPSYIERQADKDLCEGLLHGEFCYVLTSRQMGKSSLMVRTVKRLREEGVAVAVLDLTAIGQNLSTDQWYDGLISRLGQQFDLEDELLAFWENHPELGPLQRWLTAIEKVVLTKISSQIVIFVDEIDIVRSLSFSTDEFFAAIRESYNRRSQEPAFRRLAFGLLGVATPTDLIRDTRTTPFNIGRRVELHDFTREEAAPLAQGLGPDPATSEELLARILYWTGGHPYLTQRLCRALAERIARRGNGDDSSDPSVPPLIPTMRTVDELVQSLFLSRQARERDDNLIFVRERILRSEGDTAGLLYLYRKVRNGLQVTDDETNPLISTLRLAGIVRSRQGSLQVRNRIYSQVFDGHWIHANMPEPELRRQRTARRRGIAYGLGIALAVLLIYLFIWPLASRYREHRLAQKTVQQLESSYRFLSSYKDIFETTMEISVGDVVGSVKGSGSLLFERPNRVNLAVQSHFSNPELEIRVIGDGRLECTFAPALKQFQVREKMPPAGPFDLPPSLSTHLGPVTLFPLYRMFLDEPSLSRFTSEASDVQYGNPGQLDGQQVRILHWKYPAPPLLRPFDIKNLDETAKVPMTAWIGSDNRIVQLRADLSAWAGQLLNAPAGVQVAGLILTERHKSIDTSFLPGPRHSFRFQPPNDYQPVAILKIPPPTTTALSNLKKQFSSMIPPRPSFAPPELLDLTEYYNAPLVQSWHPGEPGNNLENLPRGLLQFGDDYFDIRGIVQISGKGLQKSGARYPQRINGIRVRQKCRQLHFLQAAAWTSPDGTRIGSYVVNYANGHQETIPIVYGEDLRDWSADSDPAAGLKRAIQVWTSVNNARVRVRLFKFTWMNPLPDTEIASIDFISAMTESAPFVIAISLEL